MSKQLFRNLGLSLLILFTSLFICSCGPSGSSSIQNNNNIISVVMPENGAENVSINSNFTVTFTGPVNGSSLQKPGVAFLSSQINSSQSNKSHNQLKSTSQIINLVIQTLSSNGRTVVFKLPSDTSMDNNTKYSLNLNLEQIKSANGDSIGKGTLTASTFSTELPAPTVALVTPYNGESNVSLLPSIKIAFSQAVKNVNSSNVSLHQGSTSGPNIALSQFIQGNNNVYAFSPLSNLKTNNSYYLVIDSGIVNQYNQSLQTTMYTFTTGDSTAPVATLLKPSNGANQISLTPTIEVGFSKSVNNVNLNTVSLNEGSPTGPSIAISGIVPGSNNTYTFSPSGQLKDFTTYYVTLSSGIVDNNNNPLKTTTFMFTTANNIIPTANMIMPSNGETNVTLFNPEIEIKFSSTVSNVDTDNVILHQDSESGPVVAISTIVPGFNNTYKFSTIDYLNASTHYYLVLGSGITNTAGNHLLPVSFNFTSSNWDYFGTPEFDEENVFYYLNMAINSANIPYVVYTSQSSLSVAKNDSGVWSYVGNQGFTGYSSYTSPQLALDKLDTPYIAFQYNNPYIGNVMEYESGTWNFVGGQGSINGASFPSLALDSNNNPYVGFQDCDINCGFTVQKYNSESSTWVTVGSPGFGGGICSGYTNIALDSNDNPYVAFQDASNNCTITVMEYNSGTYEWQQIGTINSPNYASFDLDIDKNSNIPYLLYQNGCSGANNCNLSIVRYDSSTSSWVSVGPAIFQNDAFLDQGQQSLAIDNNGIPYVAFRSYSNNNRAVSVMKYNPSSLSWDYVGNSNFTPPETIAAISLALDNNGVPYVAFIDGTNYGLSIMKYFGQ